VDGVELCKDGGLALSVPTDFWNHRVMRFSHDKFISHIYATAVWLRWARYLCTLTYAIRILLVEEFYDCDPGNPEANNACNDLVSNIDADPDETWWNWLVLVALFGVARIFALYILRQKSTKFF
jgi:hypothetical protein